ncbi:MAG: HDIG domain-containing metalloprotein [Desulfobacterales bacterium]
MVRVLLMALLLSVQLLAGFGEELALVLRPPREGEPAALTLRADRPWTAPDGTELRPGEIVVGFRQSLTAGDLERVRLFSARRAECLPREISAALFLGLWAIVFLHFYLFALREAGVRRRVSLSLLLALLILQAAAFQGILAFTTLPVQALPVVLLPFLVVGLRQGRLAALGAFLAGFLFCLPLLGRSLEAAGGFLLAGTAAVMFAPQDLRLRTALLPALGIGLLQAVFVALERVEGLALPAGVPVAEAWRRLADSGWAGPSLWAWAAAPAAAGLARVLLPGLRTLMEVGSLLSLRRFADLEHPLLKKLFAEAPGTYQHSLNVAYLAQAAGEAIGADGVLLRVGAYFHDIGKMDRPEAFVENQRNGVNPHDDLDPRESCAILFDHVTRSRIVCRAAGLPGPVRDLVAQHHGTQLVEYFYQKALARTPKAALPEGQFRYPGPKPRSPEAALLMIADAVEAASRTLERPGREAFEELVRRIVLGRIADQQFSECVLDTREIDAVMRALVDALEAAFHGRIAYPWQRPAAARS